MTGRRTSARLAAKQASSPDTSPQSAAGTKRKTDPSSSPSAKRGKKSAQKEQKTLEETVTDKPEDAGPRDESGKVEAQHGDQPAQPVQPMASEKSEEAPKVVEQPKEDITMKEPEGKAEEPPKVDVAINQPEEKSEEQPKVNFAMNQPAEKPEEQPKEDIEMKASEAKADEQPKIDVAMKQAEDNAAKPRTDVEMQDADQKPEEKVDEQPGAIFEPKEPQGKDEKKAEEEPKAAVETKESESKGGAEAAHRPKEQDSIQNDVGRSESKEDKPTEATSFINGESAVEPKARAQEIPSSILEKGIIYFFFRGRVGIDDPHSVNEIQRSYIVLRPVERGAKLGEGPIGDAGNNRLLALPKKTLPLSGRDRFMTFVEKAKISFQTLKDEFLPASEYETKTMGVRHAPAATPIGEGVYAITHTGRESHLAYILTVPSDLGEVQKEIGLRERGSFILSTRNPEFPAPGNAQLPEGPEFPAGIREEFRGLRWIGTKPHHLDVKNSQVLLIGGHTGLDRATEVQKQDDKAEKEEPKEELEKLEHEDELRVEGLKGDESDAVFADLGVHAKDYPKLQTTF